LPSKLRSGSERRLERPPNEPTTHAYVTVSADGHAPHTNGDIEPWEVHSELVLVCPEVYKRALELLPDRNPNAFLARVDPPTMVATGVLYEPPLPSRLAPAIARYTLWRLMETARGALVATGALAALALLPEFLH
jgi:hypothetical protein